MAPETRSRGVPAPSRVYHSTPKLHQARFPSRKRAARPSNGDRSVNFQDGDETIPSRSSSAARLRQQTLTQINFVPSAEGDASVQVIDDSEDDDGLEIWEDKEALQSRGPAEKKEDVWDVPEQDPEEEPIVRRRRTSRRPDMTATKGTKRVRKEQDDSKKKRRRTLGDTAENQKSNAKANSRRKTLDDLPKSKSSKFHTQTLTQFMGHHDHIDENVLLGDTVEDDDFLTWLGGAGSPTATKLRLGRKYRESRKTASPARAESVVPQTPSRVIRAEIPSSSQQSTTPATHIVDRQYGKLGGEVEMSPSRRRASELIAQRAAVNEMQPGTRKLFIEDSFASESLVSADKTPSKASPLKQQLGADPDPRINQKSQSSVATLARETSSASETISTPSKKPADLRRKRLEMVRSLEGKTEESAADATTLPLLKPRAQKVLFEIPDSDDEDEDDYALPQESDKVEFILGPETQRVINELSFAEEMQHIHSDEDICEDNAPTTDVEAPIEKEGALVMSSENRRHDTDSKRSDTISSASPRVIQGEHDQTPPPVSTAPRKRLRQPLIQHLHLDQTQPLESQRVSVPELQALPPAESCTDAILCLTKTELASVLEGYQVHLLRPFRVAPSVVRFWLFDGSTLQYGACASPGVCVRNGSQPETWRYHLAQVYEINNPRTKEEMTTDGWLRSSGASRYELIPPAVASELMWNLRCALFGGKEDLRSMSEQRTLADRDAPPKGPLGSLSSKQAETTRPRSKTPAASLTDSQQLEEQIRSDIALSTQFMTSDDILVPSTPEGGSSQPRTPRAERVSPNHTKDMPPPPLYLPTTTRRLEPEGIQPSQATTASQASLPDEEDHAASVHQESATLPPVVADESQRSHLHNFMPLSSQALSSASPFKTFPTGMDSSQLQLGKSQLLPDSLMRDDMGVDLGQDDSLDARREIWDSQEGG